MYFYKIIILLFLSNLFYCATVNDQLYEAVVKNKKDMIDTALSEGADINALHDRSRSPKQTVLHSVARIQSNSPDYLQKRMDYLIEKGADPEIKDSEDKTPLCIVAENPDYISLTEYLLSKGVDPNSAIACATNLPTATLLLSKSADINSTVEGETGLIKSIRTKNNELAKFLISKGADVNKSYSGGNESNAGFSPLHYAAKFRNFEIMDALLKAKAIPEINKSGRTPGDFLPINEEMVKSMFISPNDEIIVYHDLSGGTSLKKFTDIIKDQSNKGYVNISPPGTPIPQAKCAEFYSYLGYAEALKKENLAKVLKKYGATKHPKDGKNAGVCGH